MAHEYWNCMCKLWFQTNAVVVIPFSTVTACYHWNSVLDYKLHGKYETLNLYFLLVFDLKAVSFHLQMADSIRL